MARQEQIKQAGQNYAKEWNWDLSVLIGFYKGVEWADSHPNWVSVEEELPRMRDMSGQTENVLVYCDNGRIEVTYFDYGDGRFAVGYHLNVTHWQYLPQPPKKGE